MVLEAFSVAAFGAFIWAVTFMVPKAIKQRDGLAITSAVLTAVFALIVWILASVPLSGTGGQKTDSAQLQAAPRASVAPFDFAQGVVSAIEPRSGERESVSQILGNYRLIYNRRAIRCDFSSPPHPPYRATRFVDVAVAVVPGDASETVPEMISADELPGNDRGPCRIDEGPEAVGFNGTQSFRASTRRCRLRPRRWMKMLGLNHARA